MLLEAIPVLLHLVRRAPYVAAAGAIRAARVRELRRRLRLLRRRLAVREGRAAAVAALRRARRPQLGTRGRVRGSGHWLLRLLNGHPSGPSGGRVARTEADASGGSHGAAGGRVRGCSRNQVSGCLQLGPHPLRSSGGP